VILLTGGAGYIGSQTNKALYEKGFETLVLDNLINGHRAFVKWGKFEQGDLNNTDQIRLIFKKYTIEAVIHFAAYAYVGESVENPQKYYENNLRNTLNLLQVMLESDTPCLVFSSSCAVYGNPLSIPITENHPQNPINPYGKSKMMVEMILDDYCRTYRLNYVSLRYFNAAGADPDCGIGEWHEPETHLIPLVLDVASGRKDNIKIFGTDYDTPDGTCIRDYVHTIDLADAHVLALNHLLENGKSDTFNLGIGKGFSVREVIEKSREITGKNIKLIEDQRRPGDPPILIAGSEKAKTLLGWQPRYNDISEIIETSWSWHSELCKRVSHD
jgi:UDP-glucose 4-epimerase